MNTTTTPFEPSAVDTPAPQADAFGAAFRRALAQRADAGRSPAASAAAAEAARGLLAERWAATQAQDAQRLAGSGPGPRRVHYLSMEFLMGRAMHNALAALGLADRLPEALGPEAPLLQTLIEHESDAALGNGGLGRLAA